MKSGRKIAWWLVGGGLALICVVLVVGWFSINPLLKREVVRMVRDEAGLDATVDELRFFPLTGTLFIQGLRIYQPPTNGGILVARLDRVQAEIDLAQLRTNRIWLRSLEVSLDELNMSSDLGQSELWERLGKNGGKEDEMEFGGIGLLTLSIDRIRIVELRPPAPPKRLTELQLEMRGETFTNLTEKTMDQLATRIGVKVQEQMIRKMGNVFQQGP